MLTTASNWIAFLGWTVVAVMTLLVWLDPQAPSEQLLQLVLACEIISASETIRIALGILRGDLTMSFFVHYTRLLMMFATIPHAAVSDTVVKLILLAWSLTEVFRYPMVLFPGNGALRTLRYAAPLLTFPLGAGTEAYAAYMVLLASDHMVWKVVLGLVVVVNVGGGCVWYPSMVAKVTCSLKGDGKKAGTKAN